MKTRIMRAEYESGNEKVLNLIANQCFDYQNAHTSCSKICVRLFQVSFNQSKFFMKLSTEYGTKV